MGHNSVLILLTFMLLVALFGQYKMMQNNNLKMTETLANGYSSGSTQ